MSSDVDVTNKTQKGVFVSTLDLPRLATLNDRRERLRQPVFGNMSVTAGCTPRVLVVDDDVAVADSLANMLEGHGYEIIVANDVAAALRAVDASAPDVVLTDIYMPGTDGYQLIGALRSKRQSLQIVAMSGGSAELDVLEFARKLSADAVIDKPFRYAELIALIGRCLECARTAAPATSD